MKLPPAPAPSGGGGQFQFHTFGYSSMHVKHLIIIRNNNINNDIIIYSY